MERISLTRQFNHQTHLVGAERSEPFRRIKEKTPNTQDCNESRHDLLHSVMMFQDSKLTPGYDWVRFLEILVRVPQPLFHAALPRLSSSAYPWDGSILLSDYLPMASSLMSAKLVSPVRHP